jgi:3-keto-disaccharide hydrolase
MKRLLALMLLLVPAAAHAQEPKFTPLFNGRDLTGWFNINCAPGTWSVKDGMIHSTGAPICELRTERMYENFILELEWQHLKPEGNAGVFIWADALPARGEPFLRAIEVQVLDGRNTENYTSHGDVFAIHGAKMTPDRPHPNGWMRSLPRERRAKPAGQWNTYRITARDGKLTLAVNGADVSGGYDISPRKGYIALESEGSPALFRNLRIAELPSSGKLAPEHVSSTDDGFRSLYNGHDLDGWRATSGGWMAKDWTLVYSAAAAGAGGSSLVSAEDYTDFSLIVDWKIPKEGASANKKPAGGVKVKEPIRLSVSQGGEHKAVRPAGDWNRSIFTLRGGKLTVTLNGETVREGAAHEGPPRGRIVLRPTEDVEFANVFVKRY